MPKRKTSLPTQSNRVWMRLCLALAAVGLILAARYLAAANFIVSARNSTQNIVESEKSAKFYDALGKLLAKRKRRIEDLYRRDDALETRVLNDYGAVFVAHPIVEPPPVCMFPDSGAVERYQEATRIAREKVGGVEIELQAAAMNALLDARQEALNEGFDITPRDGAEAARRNFDDTLRLWDSRFAPALAHWTERGRIAPEEAETLRNLPLREQVSAVLELERRGIFFNTYFNRSILYSVAAPGCSQHLSLLAFDANEFQNGRVRQILARHGWFRTVRGDAPHFTFWGAKKGFARARSEKIETESGEFWIPNV